MSVSYYGDFSEDETVYIPFNTFDSNDPTASVTITDLVDADIKVHKDGGTTEISTDGATIAINFDAVTGNHLITIDTSASADYATGSDYLVRMEGTTVDAGTINAWIGIFSIENRHTAAGSTPPTVEQIAAEVWSTLIASHTGSTTFGGKNQKVVPSETIADYKATGFSVAGDSMNLAADAIKAVSFDESTAFPLTAVNGSTLTEAGGTGDQLTAINLPNQTMDIIGNITGNLSGSVGSVTADVTTDAASRTASQADVSLLALASALATAQTDLDTITGVDGVTLATLQALYAPNKVVPDAAGVSPTAIENRQEMDSNSTRLAAIEADTTGINGDAMRGTDNAALATELAKVPKSDGSVTWNSTALGSINAQVDLALNTAIPGSPTATSINDYVLLSKYALCNRWDITEASGDLDVYDDTNTLYQATAAAFTTLAGVTLRKKIL